jgi:hypothetical protein
LREAVWKEEKPVVMMQLFEGYCGAPIWTYEKRSNGKNWRTFSTVIAIDDGDPAHDPKPEADFRKGSCAGAKYGAKS